MFKKFASLIGNSNERAVKQVMSKVEEINALELEFEALTDEQLRAKTVDFRAKLGEGESLDYVLPKAFATVRESAKRALSQRHYDVQLIGGVVLHEGKIAEMRTGEGKTLVATLPTYLNALTGMGVHVVTVNDYLARRDAQWMGAVYHMLGLTVGVLQNQSAYLYDPDPPSPKSGMEKLRAASRKEAYAADVTYGTNNEFGFDYLRDNMVVELASRVQRGRVYAIVDEVDNILIDEARTPLIISGPADTQPKEYQRFAKLALQLRALDDYTVDEKHKAVSLTGDGMAKLERLLEVSNLYDPSNFGLVHFVENAVKAQAIYHRDRDYVVKDGEVVLVDEFTGRLMPGRRVSDGMHQALEAKEGSRIQRETITHATITLQNYFRLYEKLAGMTGTAATEAEEFFKIYKLEVVEIPTHRPMIREDSNDLIYRDQKAKYMAVVDDIKSRHECGQPVLVGTTDISKSEALSSMLKRQGIPHEVLNAKQHEREAMIVAQAGRPGAVMVATNMAGRGTDIILGGSRDGLEEVEWFQEHQKVLDAGGLHIIGTERHEARRIDNQLRGRSGRQGDPGSSRYYIALDDDLMRRFGGERIKTVMDWAGLEEEVPIENRVINKSLESAQVKVEAHHFDMRKHLVDYDDVVNTHRDVIYSERDKILNGSDLQSNVRSMIEMEVQDVLDGYMSDRGQDDWDVDGLLAELVTLFPLPPDLSNPDEVFDLPSDAISKRVHEWAGELYSRQETEMGAALMRSVERHLMLRIIDAHWVTHLTAMENLRQGIGLHAYGQRDPLVMYKKEAHDKFQELMARIQRDIAHSVYRVAVAPRSRTETNGRQRAGSPIGTPSPIRAAANTGGEPAASRKVGRNAPCPCGSGKKYKRCHGGA